MGGIGPALRRHGLVGLDTSVFIYHLDGATPLAGPAGEVLGELARGGFEGVTSVLTLMEIAVKPLRLDRADVADEYDVLLGRYPHLMVADIDRAVARRAAELRATYRLRPADALQAAACLQYGAMAFVTNDRDFRRVTGLRALLLADFAGS